MQYLSLVSLAIRLLVLVALISAFPADIGDHLRFGALFNPPMLSSRCNKAEQLQIFCGFSPSMYQVKAWMVILRAFPHASVVEVGARQGCLTALALCWGATVYDVDTQCAFSCLSKFVGIVLKMLQKTLSFCVETSNWQRYRISLINGNPSQELPAILQKVFAHRTMTRQENLHCASTTCEP